MTVQRALEKHSGATPRVITDNGTQFVSKELRAFTNRWDEADKDLWLILKVTVRSRDTTDQFNQECLQVNPASDYEDAKTGSNKEYYNSERLHSALHYLTPEDSLLGRIDQRIAERKQIVRSSTKKIREKYLRYDI
ncbi:hypothetical protein MASR2M39_11970 [Ignavibacteriales bacterium]